MLEGKQEKIFLFNLPTTWQTSVAHEIYRAELERLGRWLVTMGGAVPDEQRLLDIIREYREGRRQLLAAAERCSARQFAEAVAQFHASGSVRLPQNPAPPNVASVPLALVGAHLPIGQWDLLDVVERCGGRIVLNATNAGERALVDADERTLADVHTVNPVELLTSRYAQASVEIFHRPNSRFYAWQQERICARGVKGIVLWTQVNCDLWRAEAQTMREILGRPVCLLEEDTVEGCSLRNLSRIQSFVELLR